ncbi:unnamed protein product [Trichogramma brassicae]|uniref:Uncharacterized protein n=1 Tax=Trichogramma brassicae TaxID=86971 RepID=A0A6H5HYB6_9HYME|nr:unnamed protein product [Trichogramma brassicae]
MSAERCSMSVRGQNVRQTLEFITPMIMWRPPGKKLRPVDEFLDDEISDIDVPRGGPRSFNAHVLIILNRFRPRASPAIVVYRPACVARGITVFYLHFPSNTLLERAMLAFPRARAILTGVRCVERAPACVRGHDAWGRCWNLDLDEDELEDERLPWLLFHFLTQPV